MRTIRVPPTVIELVGVHRHLVWVVSRTIGHTHHAQRAHQIRRRCRVSVQGILSLNLDVPGQRSFLRHQS